MKTKLSLLFVLFASVVFGQLQNPDICINFFANNGNFDYSGHTYLEYDGNERKVNELGLDTITGDSLYRFETNHISAHHRETVDYRPDMSGTLVRKGKYEREVDANTGADLKAISYDWVNGMWQVQDFSTRWIYTYNGNNEMTECIQERYQSPGGWRGIIRTTYVHNGTFQVTIERFTPDGSGGWDRFEKRVQTQSTTEIVTEEVSSVNTVTNAETKTEYNTYEVKQGSSHNIDVRNPNPYLHDFEANASHSSRDLYDQNGNLNLFDLTLYTTNGDTTFVTVKRFDTANSTYNNYERRITVTDQKGESALSENQQWTTQGWTILSGFKNQRIYNGNKMTEVSSQQFDFNSKTYKDYTKSQYRFTRGIGLTESFLSDFQVFPNPASEYLQLNYSGDGILEVTIFDALGRKVLAKNLSAVNHHISLLNFPKGSYLLRAIDSNNEEVVKKILVD